MAVSQVDALKNPFKVWMCHTLVATQPPPSAPAMPIRQVMIRPCDRRPGISMLPIRPAARPRTIHARMPMMTPWLLTLDGLVPVAAHDPPQLGDPRGSRGGHDQRATDGGEQQRDG